MCGRYQFSCNFQELKQIVRKAQRTSSPDNVLNFPMDRDISPTDTAPVLIARGSQVTAEFQRWGIPGWRGGLIINARAETVCEKPMFRRSIAAQRCVIPASSYYEWDSQRHPYSFHLPAAPLYLAGIYDNVDGVDCFVILTTAPNSSVQDIHDRMPLLLTREQVRPWLTDAQAALNLLTQVPPLLEHAPVDGQLGLADYL